MSYHCTFQKGDVLQGDTACLTFHSMGGVQIDGVDIYMSSNKSSGAGILSVTADGKQVAVMTGTYKDWTGSYDNQAYHPVALLHSPVTGVDEMRVQTVGTTNSLHIEKYVIQYTASPARSVQLMSGQTLYMTLTEVSGGKGVLLPQGEDFGNWHFAGWSETEFWEVETPPHILPAGSTYYPREDGVLWAVYVYQDISETLYATELTSGIYGYVNRTTGMALTGVPDDDGRMDFALIDGSDMQQRYRIVFTEEGKAYITHDATDTPIGYQGTAMAVQASPWNVYHAGDETLFYTCINGKNYVLWLNVQDKNNNEVFYAGLFQTNPMSSPMALQMVQDTSEAVYTCHPEMQGVEEVSEEAKQSTRVLMRFGNYELRLRNGKKEIGNR